MMTMTESDTTGFMESLHRRARAALSHWGLSGSALTLLKYRENAVFRVTLDTGEPAVLRLHRPGYHDEAALASELAWMDTLRAGGLRVPAPVPTQDGRHIIALAAGDGFGLQHADIVSWIDGSPLGETGIPLPYPAERLAAIFFSLGVSMARLHALSDAWSPPATFHRPRWDAEGLVGDAPLWGRFWDCPGLSAADAADLTTLRQRLRARLAAVPPGTLDSGLIHADLVRENVIVDEAGDGIAMIDFDDGGSGFRMFDIATALFKNRSEPHYAEIEAGLIGGYRSVRPLAEAALETLPLFMALRGVTYVGWIGARLETPDARARMQRYVCDALQLGRALDAVMR